MRELERCQNAGCIPRERFLHELVMHQVQRDRKGQGIPRRRTSDLVRYQFEIQFGKVLVEELKFHFHDCFMAKEDQMRKSRASKGLDKCPPCTECGKEFFQDVKNGQVRFDVLQSNLLDTFNPKLLDVSARRKSVCGNTHFCRQSVHQTRGTCLRPTDTYPPSPLVSVHLHF